MTREPATEAGRRLLDGWWPVHSVRREEITRLVLAIEAEARAASEARVAELEAALRMAIDWEDLVGGDFDRKYPDCPTEPSTEPADWYLSSLRRLLAAPEARNG